jgi:nicotinamide mononucleotide transporter
MSTAFSNLLTWLQQHYIEVAAVIMGLVYVLYTIQENKLLWLFGIISSGLYSWVFYQSGIYAYSLLYIYYVVIGFYGWYNWSKKSADSTNHKEILHIHRASKGYLWRCIALILIIAIPIYVILNKYTVSDMALADALLTSGGMVATWMLTQKLIEQWLFWIVINQLSLSVMIYKELYPSAILFLVYTLLAVKGYIAWKKYVKTPTAA